MTTTDALLSTVAATEARVDLLGFTFDELRAWLMDAGEPAYRSRQLADAIYHQLTPSFEQMSALPAALREQLAETATIASPQTRALVASKDGRTRKLLLALRDGRLIETVLMLYPASP